MASKPVTERLCEPCEEDDKHIKARTLCYECHILLCESCSNYHKRLRSTKDHNLIELVQLFMQKKSSSKQTSTSFSEDELASDFLETVTLTEDTVLYRGAQAAVQSTSVTTKPEKRTTSEQADPRRLKATRCLEFSAKRPDDKKNVCVTGVLCVSDNVVVIDNNNKVLKLFDQSGTYLSSTELKNFTRGGITCVRDSTFATCGLSNTVYLWTVRGQTIVREDESYHVDHDVQGIHYNGTFYCVLHRCNAITILDRQGRQVRKIIMKKAFGKKFEFVCDIHMDSDTNTIYVPCFNEHGVLCMTIEGKALWFIPLSGSTLCITEIHGTLCVAVYWGACLHLITKGGEYVGKLLDEVDLGGEPDYLCYGQDNKLYVSYYWQDNKHHVISVYSAYT